MDLGSSLVERIARRLLVPAATALAVGCSSPEVKPSNAPYTALVRAIKNAPDTTAEATLPSPPSSRAEAAAVPRPPYWFRVGRMLVQWYEQVSGIVPVEAGPVLAPETAATLLLRGVRDARTLYLAGAYGLRPHHVDPRLWDRTPKPDALIVLPYDDHNGAFESDACVDVTRRLREAYDLCFIVARTDTDVVNALSRGGWSTAIVFGHGDVTDIRLGISKSECPSFKTCDRKPDHERFYLDVCDAELKDAFAANPQDMTTNLVSCSTAKGGSAEPNLTNTIAELGDGRLVIGAGGDIYPGSTMIRTVHPLELRLYQALSEHTYRVTRTKGMTVAVEAPKHK